MRFKGSVAAVGLLGAVAFAIYVWVHHDDGDATPSPDRNGQRSFAARFISEEQARLQLDCSTLRSAWLDSIDRLVRAHLHSGDLSALERGLPRDVDRNEIKRMQDLLFACARLEAIAASAQLPALDPKMNFGSAANEFSPVAAVFVQGLGPQCDADCRQGRLLLLREQINNIDRMFGRSDKK